MTRMGSSQQIDLQRGTVYSLEISWTQKQGEKHFGGAVFAQTSSGFQDKLGLDREGRKSDIQWVS